MEPPQLSLSEFRVQGFGFRGLGFRGLGLGFRVLGSRVLDFGFRGEPSLGHLGMSTLGFRV